MNKRQCKKIANRPLTERKIIGDVLFWMLPKEWNHRHMQRYFKRFVAPNTSRTARHGATGIAGTTAATRWLSSTGILRRRHGKLITALTNKEKP